MLRVGEADLERISPILLRRQDAMTHPGVCRTWNFLIPHCLQANKKQTAGCFRVFRRSLQIDMFYRKSHRGYRNLLAEA